MARGIDLPVPSSPIQTMPSLSGTGDTSTRKLRARKGLKSLFGYQTCYENDKYHVVREEGGAVGGAQYAVAPNSNNIFKKFYD